MFSSLKMVIISFLLKFVHSQDKDEIMQRRSLSLAMLYFLNDNFINLILLVFIINCGINQDVISLFYILSFFLYAAIENPFPPATYWKIILFYCVTVITFKFLYQFPMFCGTPPYSLIFM